MKSQNDHNNHGYNTEWKYKDNKWSIKNKYNGWGSFFKLTHPDNINIVWCDKCFDEKSSFTDFIKDYPSNIINHLEDKINELEKEILQNKLVEKDNEIKYLKNENNYIIQIKKYENEIQTLKNDNKDLFNKIKLSQNYNNFPNNDKMGNI